MTRIAATAIVLLVMLGAGARADDKPQNTLPPRAITHHTIVLNGRHMDYDAIAEPLDLTDRQGKTTAQIFTVSYLAQPAGGAARPVSFVFNGGPGAASVFLNLGALGPKIMETPANGDAPIPPVRLVDNESSWLPFTDLVFIDPVGTGYSRGEGSEKNPDQPFWDVENDLSSLDAIDQAVADPASALGCAGLSGRRELRRVPRRRYGAAAAARRRCHSQRSGADLTGARFVDAARQRARSACCRILPADLCRYRRGARRDAAPARPRCSRAICAIRLFGWACRPAGPPDLRRSDRRSRSRRHRVAGGIRRTPPGSRAKPRVRSRNLAPPRRGRQSLRRHNCSTGCIGSARTRRRSAVAADRRRFRDSVQRLYQRRTRLSHRSALRGVVGRCPPALGLARRSGIKGARDWR